MKKRERNHDKCRRHGQGGRPQTSVPGKLVKRWLMPRPSHIRNVGWLTQSTLQRQTIIQRNPFFVWPRRIEVQSGKLFDHTGVVLKRINHPLQLTDMVFQRDQLRLFLKMSLLKLDQ